LTADCYACSMSARLPDLPPRERVFVDDTWRVAHDFNASLEGWLVVVSLRHVEGLHELTAEEATSLGVILRAATRALVEVTGCTKTYVMLFAEKDGFSHLHLHVVPRMPGLATDRRGPAVFAYCKEEPLPEVDRDRLAVRLASAWPVG
jgi:diadenosine tetraphosphate (Ap4A) HIT family hydrolase